MQAEPQRPRRLNLPILYKLEELYFYTQYRWLLLLERTEKIKWTIAFSIMMLTFIYMLCFIDES